MPIDVYCSACDKTYRVADDAKGRRMRCPRNHPLTVPGTPARTVATPPPLPEERAPGSRVLLIGIVAAALLVLLLVGGGVVGLVLYFNARTASGPVVQRPSGETAEPSAPRVAEVDRDPKNRLPSAGPGRSNDGTEDPGARSQTGPGQDSEKPGEVPGQNPTEGPKPSAKLGFLDLTARIKVENPLPAPPKADQPVPEVWDGHTNHVRGVAFTDDGKYVVSVSGDMYAVKPARDHDYSIRLWDVRWGKQVHKVEGFAEPLDGVSVTPGGRYALFGHSGHWNKDEEWVDSTDHSVRLFDLQDKREVPLEDNAEAKPGQVEGRFRGLDSSVFCTAISPDNARIAGGANSGKLILWDAKAGKAQIEGKVPTRAHIHGVVCVRFTPDDRYLFAVSADSTLRLFDSKTGQAGRVFGNHLDIVWALAVTLSDGKLLALSGGGSRQRLDGKGFEPGARDYAIRLWDVNSGQEIRRFTGHENDVMGLAFCPNGRHFVSGSFDKTVRLWDLTTGRQLRVLGKHEDSIRSVAVSPDGRSAVSGGDDCKVRFWHLPVSGDDLAAAFKANDSEAVKKAIGDLDTMGSDLLHAYPEVVKALTHADASFHEPATRALIAIAEYCQANKAALNSPLVGDLVRALKSAKGSDQRYAIVLTLSVIGPAAKDAVPALGELLADTEDAKVTATAVKALGTIGDLRAAGALEKVLRHADAAVRTSATAALVSFGSDAVKLKTFLDLLQNDANAEVQALAEKGLRAKLPTLTKDDVPHLREGLKSSKSVVSIFCADVVLKLGAEAKDAVPELIPLLRADDRTVRLHAVRALTAIGEAAKPAASELERLLSGDGDKDRRVGAAAALALIKLDATAKKEKLIDVLLKGLKPEGVQDLDDPAALALAEQSRDVLVEIGKPTTEPLLNATTGTFRGADRLNTEARANVYRVLVKLGKKANTGNAGRILTDCVRREADLVKNSLPNTPEGDQRRKTHELAKQAYAAVYGAKD
jgi:WD40 repeat protein/HEAT repeat protein